MRIEAAKRLRDVADACEAIIRFTRTVDQADFATDELRRAAVERKFEIVGEALGKACADDRSIRERVPDAPRIVALRNRLIHGYDSVDDAILWDIATRKVPVLLDQVAAALTEAGHDPGPPPPPAP